MGSTTVDRRVLPHARGSPIYLDRISQHLVESQNFVGHAQVDRPVANLYHESTEDLAVDLVLNLELLSCSCKLGLRDGCFELLDDFAVQGLSMSEKPIQV